MEKKIYILNNNHYFQQEIKFIQFRELIDLLLPLQEFFANKDGDELSVNIQDAIKLFGDNFLQAIAVVLVPENKTVRDRDLSAVISDLEMEPLTKIEEIIEDFFLLNDLRSHAGRISKIFQNIASDKKPVMHKKSTGKKSSTPSATETSPE